MSKPSNKDTVEVITTVARRRRFSPSEKAAIVMETRGHGRSVSSVARERGIAASMLFQWRKLMDEGALESLGAEEQVVPVSKVKDLEARIRNLECSAPRFNRAS